MPTEQPSPASADALPRAWDVIVIGAGVLGTFHAYFAARKGLRTLLIERGDEPQEASVRNFGTLVPSAMTPGQWLDRAKASIEIYKALAEQVRLPLTCRGTQYLATTPGELGVLEEFSRVGPRRGYRCEILGGDESVKCNPAIEPASCLGSLYFPDDCRIEPRGLFGRMIPWMSRELPCTFLRRTVAIDVSLDHSDCRVTVAGGGTFRAGHVFVCGGADFRTLFPQKLSSAGLVRCKLQMLRTAPQRSCIIGPTIASGLSIRWYSSFRICRKWGDLQDQASDPDVSHRGIHILMVQDANGKVVIGDSHEYSPGDLLDESDAAVEACILREARRLARLQTWEVSERWLGIYSLHPDQPLFRESIDGRIHLITGIGGKGMTTGPAVARESIDAIT